MQRWGGLIILGGLILDSSPELDDELDEELPSPASIESAPFTPARRPPSPQVQPATTDQRLLPRPCIKDMGRTTTVLVRGSNQLVLDEAERSLHDALCVVRCLVNKKFLIAGGGASELELSRQLGTWAKILQDMENYCVRAFAEALEVIPYTLAENAGLDPISILTEHRNRHAHGEINAGINVRKGQITNILEENVVQPLLVSTSAITLATVCVLMILKIDDIVNVR